MMDIDSAQAEIDKLDAEALQAIAEADFHAIRPSPSNLCQRQD
jgi:hypothetical protein